MSFKVPWHTNVLFTHHYWKIGGLCKDLVSRKIFQMAFFFFLFFKHLGGSYKVLRIALCMSIGVPAESDQWSSQPTLLSLSMLKGMVLWESSSVPPTGIVGRSGPCLPSRCVPVWAILNPVALPVSSASWGRQQVLGVHHLLSKSIFFSLLENQYSKSFYQFPSLHIL